MVNAIAASSLRRQLVMGIYAFVALGSLLVPRADAAELPPPPIQYPYYTLPSVSVEVHGSYSEHYEAPTTHDTEDIEFHFDLSRSYSDVEWWSSTSPPSTGSQLGFTMKPTNVELAAMGTYRSEESGVGGKTECTYSQKSSELESSAEAPFAGLIEMRPNAEAAGAMSVRFSYPLAANFLAVGGEECEFVKAVGTSGTFEQESEAFREALSPVDLYAVDSTSGAAEQTFTFSHPYSHTVNGDTVDLSAETIVKVDRLPPLPPTPGTGGPPEVRGPTTPITPPGPSPKPPVIPEPELGPEPPAVTGGGSGGPPKLTTGITAKCPSGVKQCKVAGIVEGELPIGRRASTASVSRAGRKVRHVVLGRVSFVLAGEARRKVTITLSKSGAAFLRAHPGVRAKIAVTVSAPGWVAVTRSRTARLRLPSHRH